MIEVQKKVLRPGQADERTVFLLIEDGEIVSQCSSEAEANEIAADLNSDYPADNLGDLNAKR